MADAAKRERRRLAAILVADVVGYTALIAADEAGTLARLRALFREAVRPLVAEHGGRVFQLLGDAVLAEFPSAVEALRCAIAVQAAAAARAAAEPGAAPIALRIGVALGDVAVEGGGLLFGDGVNVAARLQALAEPGGILVSGAVADQAAGRVACALEDAGPLVLKNVPRPVPAFRVRAGTALAGLSAPPASGPPSLVVLPFANLGGDAAEDYFADGITEELTTALARVRWFHVVDRKTAFGYQGRHVDVRQIGRELGVRYALEGSVRRASGRLRISGQLVDAGTGRHVWADRFEGAAEDVFALQDAVAEAVAGAIEPTLKRAEIERARAKPAASLDAYDLYLRALPLRLRTTREDNDAALALLRRAMALDPGFAPAKALALHVHIQRANHGWDQPGERDEAIRLARDVLTAHGDDPSALASIVHVLGVFADDTAGALATARRALALNPHSAGVQTASGWAEILGRQHRVLDRALPARHPPQPARHLDRLRLRRPRLRPAGGRPAGGGARLRGGGVAGAPGELDRQPRQGRRPARARPQGRGGGGRPRLPGRDSGQGRRERGHDPEARPRPGFRRPVRPRVTGVRPARLTPGHAVQGRASLKCKAARLVCRHCHRRSA